MIDHLRTKSRLRRFFQSFVGAGVFMFFQGCQTVIDEPPESAWEQRNHLHQLVWKTVNDYYYDSAIGGLNWDEVGFDSQKAVMNTSTIEDVYAELDVMVDKLDDKHTYILSPKEFEEFKHSEFVGVGFTGIRHPDEQDLDLVFSVIPEGPADRAGVQAGWLFLNGRDIKPGNQKNGVSVLYRFLDQYGILHEIKLVPAELPKNSYKRESKILEADTLYIRFDNFNEGLEHWFAQQLVDHADKNALIIDVRWNPGGRKYVLDRILSLLLPPHTGIGTTVTRNENPRIVQTPRVRNMEVWQGSIVVLISPYSASCSEILARVLQFHHKATIMGSVSAGEVLFSPSWALPGGGLLRVAARDYLDPAGVRLQDKGVEPDILIEPRSFFEIRRGHDPLLERAVEMLR